MSMIIPDEVNMIRIFGDKSRPGSRNRTDYCPINDKMVFIKGGELLSGELTKATVGTASGGLNHIIWKEKGPKASRDFLTNCQSVINLWL
jgi:DNA-directed RNA polymerase II subunit RPB1